MNISHLILLGGHIQALGLARQTFKKGLKVSVICADKYSVARWSNSVSNFYCCVSDDDLLEQIKEISNSATMLFPTSDEYIEFIARNRIELDNLLYVALPDNNIVDLFANKINTYKFSECNNIDCPKCWYPSSLYELQPLSEEIIYPCVVKPAIMYSFHKTFGKKAYKCENKHELMEIMEMIEGKGYPINKIVIQEFLSGGAKNLYSFGTFAVNGKSYVDIQVNRIRQNPMDFGNSTTYCITSNHKEIEYAAHKILELTHYTGMGEIEFMYDDGKYKFLEINTRAWKWHTISNQRKFSFIGAWIDYLNGHNIEHGNNDSVAWIESLTDCFVILKEIIKGRMGLNDVHKNICKKCEHAVWSLTDPLPAIMYIILSPILYLKRY